MKPTRDKPVAPLPETHKPQPEPEKSIESWEGEGGKAAPAENLRRGRREPEGRRK